MIELIVPAEDCSTILTELTASETERCAILYASQTVRADRTVRLLARDFEFPAAADYTRKGVLEAQLSPAFVARVTKRARRETCALVFAHSHPGTVAPAFSEIDSSGEGHLSAFLQHRHPNLTHTALVVSRGGIRARRLGTSEPVRVISLGPRREILFDPTLPLLSSAEMFDRQVRAFGSAGQEALQRLRTAIVGLGGTGSIVAQQLVHLGVRDFILVDPDTLESSNLNRVVGATMADVGRGKVELAERYIRAFAEDLTVATIKGDVIKAQTARELLNADVIFGCTDSHGSRAVLQQLAYQYFIPCIDMGTTINAADEKLTHIIGRAQLLAPGLACFTCGNLLDPNEVRRDMMTTFERQADPYIQGERVPAPAVMSLNGTIASLAVTMLLAVVTGLPMNARHLLYNAIASTLRSVRAQPMPNCYICSRSGALGRGDSWPLMARQD